MERLQGFLSCNGCSLCCSHSTLEKSSSAAGAGGPGGLAGIRPAPLWRLPRELATFAELVGPAGVPGDRFLRGGAWEAAVEPEG